MAAELTSTWQTVTRKGICKVRLSKQPPNYWDLDVKPLEAHFNPPLFPLDLTNNRMHTQLTTTCHLRGQLRSPCRLRHL